MTFKTTTRERYFLLAALLIAIGFGYYWSRYAPRQKAISRAEREAAVAHSEMQKTKLLPEPLQQPEKLKIQLDALRHQVEMVQSKNFRLRERYLFAADESVRQNALVDLSLIANATAVEIRDSVPVPSRVQMVAPASGKRRERENRFARTSSSTNQPNVDSALHRPLVTESMLIEIGKPRLQRLTLVSDFAALRAFIGQLEALSHQVVVLDFNVTTVDVDKSAPSGRLTTDLLLAL